MIERGSDPDEAIETVRSRRGDGHAFGNETFGAWLTKEIPPS